MHYFEFTELNEPKQPNENDMKKQLNIALVVLTAGVASAHIPVTESTTILDQNLDGANFAGNYRVVDDCNSGAFQRQSKGLAFVQVTRSYENDVNGLKSKNVELAYTYMRTQGGGKFEIKSGTVTIEKLKKITDVKKMDGEVVSTNSRLEADGAVVVGDLADDSSDGRLAIQFSANGKISFNGKGCDSKVMLTPTTDTIP
jgi:hypothetical protein